jgi:hypothetical protein
MSLRVRVVFFLVVGESERLTSCQKAFFVRTAARAPIISRMTKRLAHVGSCCAVLAWLLTVGVFVAAIHISAVGNGVQSKCTQGKDATTTYCIHATSKHSPLTLRVQSAMGDDEQVWFDDWSDAPADTALLFLNIALLAAMTTMLMLWRDASAALLAQATMTTSPLSSIVAPSAPLVQMEGQ